MSHEKMSADELAAICERDAAVGALIARGALIPGPVVMAALDDRGRLLRHIAALEAERRACPVAPCDREALGWAAYLMIEWRATECTSASVRQAWDRLKGTERRELYCHAGEALHAAGAASRQAEVDALRADVDRLIAESADGARWCHECMDKHGVAPSGDDEPGVLPRMTKGFMAKDAEIARLTAERDALAKQLDLGPAEVATLAAWGEEKAKTARLTRDLATARDCGQAEVCATPPGCARHWEERNRELASALAEWARKEGVARAERDIERTRVERLTAELAAQRTSANAVIDALEARVRAFQRVTGEADAEAVTPEMVEAQIERLTAERDAQRAERICLDSYLSIQWNAEDRREGESAEEMAIRLFEDARFGRFPRKSEADLDRLDVKDAEIARLTAELANLKQSLAEASERAADWERRAREMANSASDAAYVEDAARVSK